MRINGFETTFRIAFPYFGRFVLRTFFPRVKRQRMSHILSIGSNHQPEASPGCDVFEWVGTRFTFLYSVLHNGEFRDCRPVVRSLKTTLPPREQSLNCHVGYMWFPLSANCSLTCLLTTQQQHRSMLLVSCALKHILTCGIAFVMICLVEEHSRSLLCAFTQVNILCLVGSLSPPGELMETHMLRVISEQPDGNNNFIHHCSIHSG